MIDKSILNDLMSDLVDNAPLAVTFIDMDYNIVWVNQKYQQVTGTSLQEMEGKKCYITRDLTEPCRECPAKKAIESGEFCEAELTPLNQEQWPDTHVSLLVKAIPIRDKNNNIIGTIEIAYDITERKKAEAALRESEDQLHTLIDAMPDFICFKDGEGRWLRANDAAVRIFQLGDTDYIGMKDVELAELNSHLKGVFLTCDKSDEIAWNNKRFFSGEENISQPDGTILNYDVTKVPVFHPDGRRKGIVVIGHDITEYKKAEKNLQKSEEKYRSLTENMSDLVYSINLDCILTYISPQIKRYGIDPETLLSKNILEIIHPDDRENIAAEYQRSLKTGEEFPSTFRILDAKGEIHWFEDIGKIQYDKEGNIVGLAGVLRDITKQKNAEKEKARIENQFHQVQKMESVGRLAGGIAHDSNNMLGVIIGYTEMLQNRAGLDEQVYTALQEIHKAADRSSKLTKQLLGFARRQTVLPRILNLNETVDGMLRMLIRIIGEDKNLSWLPGTNLWPIKMDPAQIDQILVNLCVNGRDAIDGVGKITIETDNIVLDESYCSKHSGSVPGEYVLLSVSDDGCGMEKETLDHLFEPFFTTKKVGHGTGLGLSTVYGIIKQNNGFIYVDSEPDKGTTFRIYLPRDAGKIKQMQKIDPPEHIKHGHETILLVEDEPAILKMTKTMLEIHGYSVLTAAIPGEAIRIAREYDNGIHLVLTDVVMPEMNGRDLAKSLISFYPNILILFMSGYTANVIAQQHVLDKDINFIQKPFTMQDLAAKVREVLDNK